MNNLDRNSEKSITLEDLLKLKRQEKPSDAFWEKFDQELRQKTLGKLVYKTSFIARLTNLFTVSFRPALSAGALALLAIAIQPAFFSRTASVLVENVSSVNQDSFLADFASVKRNYVKNSISAESDGSCHYSNMLISPSSLNGVRYLAGNIASVNLGASISNTIY